LKAIAEVLHKELRPCDIVGRFGGEEFICVFGHDELEDRTIVSDRVMAAIRSIVIRDKKTQKDINITASVGAHTFFGQKIDRKLVPHEEIERTTKGIIAWTLKSADEAMYLVKESTRNRALFLDKVNRDGSPIDLSDSSIRESRQDAFEEAREKAEARKTHLETQAPVSMGFRHLRTSQARQEVVV
jgi:diguanylate cyclase (GGDEF)-like protein